MPEVLFVSEGEDAPSTRYRATAFFSRLERAGWSAGHLAASKRWSDRARVLLAARRADVVVVLRKTFTPGMRWLLRRAARRLVLDLDDAVYLRDDGTASGTRAKRFRAMVQRCDAVFAGNATLAQAAAACGAQATVLPTAVDPSKYPRASPPGPGGSIDAVWIGSSSTRKYIEGLLPTLAAAARVTPGLRLKVISDFQLSHPGLEVLCLPWSERDEAVSVAASHLGLAPMPDDPWTRGKCGLKALQYMAAGLPVLASDAGVHREIVEHGRTGWLCAEESQWVRAIADLAADGTAWSAMGEAGRRRLCERYSVDAVFERLLGALQRVLKGDVLAS